MTTSLLAWATGFEGPLTDFEQQLPRRLFALGILLVEVFLRARQERVFAAQGGSIVARVARTIRTVVGLVHVVRLYVRKDGASTCPVDADIGLLADRNSSQLLALAVRLATRMSYQQAHEVLSWFVPEAPSPKAIQQAVLGLGRHTEEFFKQRAAPADDGEVLVLLFDGKAIPTATEGELNQRRGPQSDRPRAPSPRHRGRQAREDRPARRRRQPGDKAKNGRGGTMAVMYTLTREGDLLLGPVNKRVYATMGSKRHAFEVARREATKRGFGPGTGKLIQVVTDGDLDLAALTQEFFPEALHTLDCMHALEYVGTLGRTLYRHKGKAFLRWFEEQRGRLLDGEIEKMLAGWRESAAVLPRRGPGSKERRETVEKALVYLEKRVGNMNYAELAEQDLELGSGAVEGAINHVMVKRFDQGGMRWIVEHAQPLLQLRCIDFNGDWEAFLRWVLPKLNHRGKGDPRARFSSATPSPLPGHKMAA